MIRSIVESSMRLRPLVIVIAVVIMIVGITSFDKMAVDIFPEILPVTVHVHTEALGLSAGEVEQLITVPIEADLLAGTPWVEFMRSESVPGLSSIELTFKRGTNPMHARQMVQERLTQAHALPNVSKPPQMLQPLSSTNRVMLIGLSSKAQSLIEMSVLARWTIRTRLMGVPGVANVAIWGQRERQLQVQVDPERLREKGVSLMQVVKTAGNALWYSPLTFLESSVAGTGGFIETPNQRIGIRHVLPITVASDLAKVPVDGSTLRLDQVATVVEDHQPLIGDALQGNGPGLLLVIEKLPGVNTLEVTDNVMKALDALKPGLGGIEFDPSVYHPAAYIRTAIRNIGGALLIGLILVAAVLLALSRNWRAALVGVIAIPMSLVIAALVIHTMGATINMMILAGLVIALGIVVDDGILLVDGLLRRLREGTHSSIPRLMLEASSEMRGPLAFATAIVLLAALPLLFLPDATGALVRPMVLAYGAAVLASTAVAMTLTIALTLLLFQNVSVERRPSSLATRLMDRSRRIPPLVPQVAWALTIVATLAGLALLPRMRFPAAPTFKEPDLLVKWEALPGTSRQEMNRMIERVGRELRSIPGVRNVGGHVGRAILSDQVVGIHSCELWVNVDHTKDYEATVAAVERVVDGYPGVDGQVTTYLRARFADALSRVHEPIRVRLYGQELDVLSREAEIVRKSLEGIAGIHDARIHHEATEPVVEIEVNLEAAELHGVKPGDVRRSAATLLAGIEVGNLFEEQKIFEVVVWGEPQVRHSIASIKNLLVDTPRGTSVRLGDVADVRIVAAPHVIHRENVARCLDVVADVKGRDVAAVAAEVQARLKGARFPLEYRAELLGDYARQESARMRVFWVVVATAIGILFVLQAAFGSWLMALAVLTTLPVALAGGVIAASVTSPSLGALAGLLTVLGVAVRHTVILIRRYRDLRRREGLNFGPDLIARGTRERATSILTSGVVVAAAVAPLAFLAARPGLEILGPLAMVVLGGLATSTLYTLCVVPVLYARFGANVVAEAADEEDLGIAVESLVPASS